MEILRTRWGVVRAGLGSIALVNMVSGCNLAPEEVRGMYRHRKLQGEFVMMTHDAQANFNGVFELCEDTRDEQLAKVEEDIIRVVQARFGNRREKIQERAKEKLGKYAKEPDLPKRFALIVSKDSIAMELADNGWRVYAPDDGKEVVRKDWDRDKMKVSFGFQRDSSGRWEMFQRFKKRKGTRTNVSHLEDNGKRLLLTVTLDSTQLGEPFVYEVTYCRV